MYKHEMLDQSVKLLMKNMAFLRALEKKITSPDPGSINLEETTQANQQLFRSLVVRCSRPLANFFFC